MKKEFFLTALILTMVLIATSFVYSKAKQVIEDPQAILYQDVIITALAPTVNKAINDYYKNILTDIPGFDTTSVQIIKIDRPNGDRTWKFIIKIEVIPYIGPHISVGKDLITIELSYPGLQVIKNYNHVEDYPLPERYKHLYIQ